MSQPPLRAAVVPALPCVWPTGDVVSQARQAAVQADGVLQALATPIAPSLDRRSA